MKWITVEGVEYQYLQDWYLSYIRQEGSWFWKHPEGHLVGPFFTILEAQQDNEKHRLLTSNA